jgi:hypothetical protein
MKKPDALRKQLVEILDFAHAHVDFDTVIKGIPPKLRGVKPKNLPYSIWQLLEHLRLAQSDILDFCRNRKYKAMKWPDDYWPKKPAPPSPAAWTKSVAAYRSDRKAFQKLTANPQIDLFAKIPHGDGQTYLREILLAVDHAAFHIGEIVVARRLLGVWK